MTGQWAVYHLLPLASVTIGETVYNLRAALDYLIFEIARANNGGKNVSGTQFPIESSEETYWARSTGKTPDGKRVAQYLRKVPQPVVADLAQYQPFAGCEWTRMMQALSNADKHQAPSGLRSNSEFIQKSPILLERDPETGDERQVVIGDVEVQVFLTTGEDVVDTLKLLQRETRALIRSYANLFQVTEFPFA
jgi:hypothetical protein